MEIATWVIAGCVGVLHPARTIIAPRGELDPGALELKGPRKRFVLSVLRWFGLAKGVVWHASTDDEASNIRAAFGPEADVVIASNLRSLEIAAPRQRASGPNVRVVFMSKIDRKKNLETAVETIARCPSATLTVMGPIKDEEYWAEVLEQVEGSGLTGRFIYVGPVDPEQVIDRLAEFDLFFLPSHGENFGHAILEALAAGLPVLVGERTPWSHIEALGAGWVAPAESTELFAQRIRVFGLMSDSARYEMRRSAAQVAHDYVSDPAPLEAHRDLFLQPERVR